MISISRGFKATTTQKTIFEQKWTRWWKREMTFVLKHGLNTVSLTFTSSISFRLQENQSPSTCMSHAHNPPPLPFPRKTYESSMLNAWTMCENQCTKLRMTHMYTYAHRVIGKEKFNERSLRLTREHLYMYWWCNFLSEQPISCYTITIRRHRPIKTGMEQYRNDMRAKEWCR